MKPCTLLGSATLIANAQTRDESQIVSQTGEALATAVAVCHREERIEEPITPAGWTEEVGAVVSGRFELVFDDDTRILDAGQAAAIDEGQPHVWRCISERGVLYRVALKSLDQSR